MRMLQFIIAAMFVVGCISPTPTPQTFNPSSSAKSVKTVRPVSKQAGTIAANSGDTDKDNEFAMPAVKATDKIIKYGDNYIIAFNENTLIANWVAYELTKEQTYGTGNRKAENMQFRQDSTLKFKQADYTDYRRSGFVKGHMAPAADFKINNEAMWTTFYFPNCIPQPHDFNQSQWEHLESRVRGWARNFESVYLVTGTVVGKAKNGKIGTNGVVVPDIVYKALLTSKNGKYQAIAFIMDNDDSCPSFEQCVYTIDDLEHLTGLDFFPRLDDVIEEKVESTYDLAFWQISR